MGGGGGRLIVVVRCKLGFQVEGEQSRETGREDVVRGHRRAKEREGILRGVEWNTRPQRARRRWGWGERGRDGEERTRRGERERETEQENEEGEGGGE